MLTEIILYGECFMTKLQLKLAQIYEEKGYESTRLFWAEIQENIPAPI